MSSINRLFKAREFSAYSRPLLASFSGIITAVCNHLSEAAHAFGVSSIISSVSLFPPDEQEDVSIAKTINKAHKIIRFFMNHSSPDKVEFCTLNTAINVLLLGIPSSFSP